jgi:hypothetical protein
MTAVTTSSGTTVQWDGSSIEAPEETVDIKVPADPPPDEDPFPVYTSSHPDDGVDTNPSGGGGGSGPPAPAPDPAPVEVATKPPEPEKSNAVDPKDLKKFLADHGYPKSFIDKVTVNPKLGDYGKTGKDPTSGKLVTQIGPDALKSPEILKSTLDHELKHVEQARNGNYHKDSLAAETVNDVEAYRTEIANAKANGVPDEHLNQLNKQLNLELEYLRRTDPAYYEQVMHNDYTLRDSDKQKISE